MATLPCGLTSIPIWAFAKISEFSTFAWPCSATIRPAVLLSCNWLACTKHLLSCLISIAAYEFAKMSLWTIIPVLCSLIRMPVPLPSQILQFSTEILLPFFTSIPAIRLQEISQFSMDTFPLFQTIMPNLCISNILQNWKPRMAKLPWYYLMSRPWPAIWACQRFKPAY